MPRRKITNRLQELIARKSRLEQRRISRPIVAKETGVALSTIHAWAQQRTKRFDEDVIIKFLEYFGCDLADLLVVDDPKVA